MKKILVINNQTRYLENIKESLKNVSYEIINFDKVNFEYAKNFTHIILTGGTIKITGNNLLKEEIKIIKESNKPILGICFGHQLICYVFGSKLEQLENKKKGIFEIKKLKEDLILKGTKNPIKVFENHDYKIKDLPNQLKILAISDSAIEIVKHKEKSIYGFQFHPEINNKRMIKNFIEYL
jgi:GMP synthase (glutamine-hydrolysing)